MKERVIKIAILSVVFVLAIIGFSYWINRGNTGIVADMGTATMPTVSFEVAGKNVNMTVGHKREMDMVSMRDTIAIYDKTDKLTLYIHHAQDPIDEAIYTIYQTDGKEKLCEETVNEVGEELTLDLKNALGRHREGILKLTLMQEGNPLYYYTRIGKDRDYHVKECLSYVEELHSNILKKQNEADVKKVMEPSAEGKKNTLQHVTIHSDISQIMWGMLEPKREGDLQMEIKEVRESYVSVLLKYQVKCAGDNNETEYYNVNEFFKVAYGTKRIYLLEYDRVAEEVFKPSNVLLSAKGVILGIAKEDLDYSVNEAGTIVTFIQAGELWNYNKEADAFSLIFSFAEAESQDIRNKTDLHSIRVLSMDEEGNLTFSVCGYMNRGLHEGESGIAIYYYHQSQNAVEEVAFIPSTQSRIVIEEELQELTYYSKERNALYVLSDGDLKKIDMKDRKQTILISDLIKGQYATSDDGSLFAYQKQTAEGPVTKVWDFSNEKERMIASKKSEVLIPLGFVDKDFVYGISSEQIVGQDISGAKIQAMYRLEIQNEKQEIVKTYEEPDVYILDAVVDNNVITLKKGVKDGSYYREVAKDYITNTQVSSKGSIILESYWTDLKQTQYRLKFAKGIRDKKAKVLRPKQMLQEAAAELEFDVSQEEKYFYVYGTGTQAGIFTEAGGALELANKVAGVVISPNGNYIWEDGNRDSWYRNFEVGTFVQKQGETKLSACVQKVLSYEGKKADATAELSGKSVEQVLQEQLGVEAVRFRGCSSKDMFYLIDKGTPVIALRDNKSAVLLVGYDAKTVTYLDPADGSSRMVSIEAMDEMLQKSGQTFIGYVK